MGWPQLVERVDALKRLLDIALQQKEEASAVVRAVVKAASEEAKKADKEVASLINSHRSLSLENYEYKARAGAESRDLRRQIAKWESGLQQELRYQILEQERAELETKCKQREAENALLVSENLLLRDKLWKATGEGFPVDVENYEVSDPSICPSCGEEHLTFQHHDKYQCSYCGQVFSLGYHC